MKRDLIIFTQRPGASTPKDLKRELDCRKLGQQRTRQTLPVPRGTLVINWGGSRYPDWAGQGVTFINDPEAVRRKTSKVGQIRRFREAGVPTLEVTTDLAQAQQWQREGVRVLARRDGSFGGRGIVVVEPTGRLERNDFYSKYFAKTHEYRVHVFQGRVIDIAQKKRRHDRAVDADDRTLHSRVVRSYDNGWIFAHNDLHMPDGLRDALSTASIGAIRALGLDFGAVDVLVRFSKQNPNRLLGLAVCEVNTAPGVECTQTLNAYVNAIRTAYENRR